MKILFIVLFMGWGIQVHASQSEYRELTAADGRVITAKLIGYDDLGKKVTVQPKGLGFKTVPISLFSETDQVYITSWSYGQDFLSTSKLKAEVQRWKVRDDEMSFLEEGIDHLYHNCSFTLTLDNRATTDFNDVKLEYVIVYTQDRHTGDRSQRKTKNGSKYGSETISLPSKSTQDFETQKVVIYNFNNSAEKNLEGDVDGILIKLTWKSLSGEKVIREFRFPENTRGIWSTKDKEP